MGDESGEGFGSGEGCTRKPTRQEYCQARERINMNISSLAKIRVELAKAIKEEHEGEIVILKNSEQTLLASIGRAYLILKGA